MTRRMNLDLASIWPITNLTLGHDQCGRPSFSVHPVYLFFTEWRSISRNLRNPTYRLHTEARPDHCRSEQQQQQAALEQAVKNRPPVPCGYVTYVILELRFLVS